MCKKSVNFSTSPAKKNNMVNVPFSIWKNDSLLLKFEQIGDTFDLNSSLFCGEFVPPLPNETRFIHFSEILYLGEKLKLYPFRSYIDLNLSNENQRLNIIEPVPVPLPETLNVKLKSDEDPCTVHLFHEEIGNDQLKYFYGTFGPWNCMEKIIMSIIEEKKLPLFNISVSVVTDCIVENNSFKPVLSKPEPIKAFFQGQSSYLKGQRVMILVILSNNDLILEIDNQLINTSDLPLIPRRIAQIGALKFRNPSAGSKQSSLFRKLVVCAINSGVATELIGLCKLSVNDADLLPEHFSRSVLHLCNVDISTADILSELDLPIGNLDHYLNVSSNEASWCGLFWFPVLNRFFRSGETRNMPPNHRIVQEWSTKLLYEIMTPVIRNVDLVGLIDLQSDVPNPKRPKFDADSTSIPILTVEASRFGFSLKDKHKDYSKMNCLLSANCVKLAHDLRKIGKKPDEARAYGILIGGTQIQLCVAHAEVVKVDDTFEIHAVVTADEHWFMNLLSDDSHQECSLPCCSRTKKAGLESIIPKSRNFDFEKAPSMTGQKIQISEDSSASSIGSELELLSTDVKTINVSCLKKLKTFINCIKERIEFLQSSKPDILDDGKKQYKDPSGQIYFSQANPVNESGSSLTSCFKITKSSLIEYDIYMKCSTFYPYIFPRVYNVEILENGTFSYEFEKMTPLSDGPLDDFVSHVKFAIDCLFGLYLLHERIGIFHCDISPRNLMFSEVDLTWKLFDFNLSRWKDDPQHDINLVVGTRGYIARECEWTGIYNAASDVFSLGMVFYNYSVKTLLRNYEDEEEFEESEEYFLVKDFRKIVAGMINSIEEQRISVMTALSKFYHLLEKTISSESSNLFRNQIIQSVRNLVKKAVKEEQTDEIVCDLFSGSKVKETKVEESVQFESEAIFIESHQHEMQM